MPFEPQLPSAWQHLFHGHIEVNVSDPEGVPASTIISMQDTWNLLVRWQVHGLLVPSIGGTWHVRAYLESIGPGPEALIAKLDLPMTGQTDYSHTFHISPIDPAYPKQEGPYQLVVVITSSNLLGQPAPFAGYEEAGIIQLFPGPSLPQTP